MNLILIGISHRTAPVSVRERFSFTRERLKTGLQELKGVYLPAGAVILSTCNRMEIYAQAGDIDAGTRDVIRFLADTFSVTKTDIDRHFYTLNGADVIRHICRVAGGLDSQVLGETQILGQVRSAWDAAKQIGAACGLLDDLFAEAVNAGRDVRALTGISLGNVSVGSVAIKMIEERLEGIRDKSILVIGVGKTGGLICNYLKERDVKGIFVSNRTYARACELAAACGGKAVRFDRLKEELKTANIVISVTSSPHIVLTYRTLSDVMCLRDRALFIMDLAVPRDVDDRARTIPGISLFTLDDLASVVGENYARRLKEAEDAEKIVQKKIDDFMRANPHITSPLWGEGKGEWISCLTGS